jgi:hypothetical protein
VSGHQSRQVDYGSADDGFLDAEAPDLGPLQEAADAAELAEATSRLTDGSGGSLPTGDPLHPIACAIARALAEAGFTLHHCARHHPRYRLAECLLPVVASHAPAGKAGVVVFLDRTRPAVARLVPLARVPQHSGGHEWRARPCTRCAGFPGDAVRLWRSAYRDGCAADRQPITECSCLSRPGSRQIRPTAGKVAPK